MKKAFKHFPKTLANKLRNFLFHHTRHPMGREELETSHLANKKRDWLSSLGSGKVASPDLPNIAHDFDALKKNNNPEKSSR